MEATKTVPLKGQVVTLGKRNGNVQLEYVLVSLGV
jgi:hypothetical protein